MAKKSTAKKKPAAKSPTTVKLVVGDSDMQRDFTLKHAQRVLSMKNNGGWKLPEDSKFEFDAENGLRLKSNTGSGQAS